MRPVRASRIGVLAFAAAGGVIAGTVRGQTVQTIGGGSAVKFVDRFADFNRLATNGTPLSDYTEAGLFIGTDGDSWVGEGSPPFDPFHGANGTDHAFYCPYGGSPGYTVIQTTDGRRIYALEFMYGNGWTTGDIYGPFPWGNDNAIVQWQARRGTTVVGSGTIGDGPLLEMGTIVGFYDPAGFDQVQVRCTIASSGDPNLQALALDNLAVQITCPADWDHSGAVTPSDIAAFVNDWFTSLSTGQLTGDFDANGLVEPADIATFVNAWFGALSTGC